MYQWTKDSIRFRIDAAETTKFDDKIIARILPDIPPTAHVCDAGCGLGYTSLALARHCARVTAVDTSKEALAVLRGNMEKDGVKNIGIVQGDLFSMRPKELYDAMVFCFFGRVEETLLAAKAQCGGTVYLVKKNWRNHRFTPGEVPLKNYTFQQTQLELDALGIPYCAQTFPVEMGQPFRSLEDAMLFFKTYRQAEDAEEIAPERVKRLLCENDSSELPYFLPASRTLGLIAIQVRDIPNRFRDTRAEIGGNPVSR